MKVIGSIAGVLLVLVGCSFDRAGLGARGGDSIDAATADGSTNDPVDSAPGAADAKPSPDAPVDATPLPPDATIGVACGNATCGGQQVCCVTFGGGGGQQLNCADSCNGGALSYACDGPEDCGNQDCCLDSGGGGSQCKGSCGFGSQLTCRSDGDCPNQQSCCPANVGNISVCRAICF